MATSTCGNGYVYDKLLEEEEFPASLCCGWLDGRDASSPSTNIPIQVKCCRSYSHLPVTLSIKDLGLDQLSMTCDILALRHPLVFLFT